MSQIAWERAQVLPSVQILARHKFLPPGRGVSPVVHLGQPPPQEGE